MPKRKLSELEEDDLTPTAKKCSDATTCGEEHETSTLTASPASPTECASTSCIPEAIVDDCVPGCSADANGPSTSTQDGFTQVRKKRKSVKFNGVTVYYFPRKQGFICVPSQGGSTLGMSEKHMQTEKYSVGEYARAQRRIHKEILREQQKAAGITGKRASRQKSDDSSSVGSESSSDSEDDLNVDEYYFLQPVPTRQRRILLRQSGIKKIDTIEKEECRDIRTSREMCGCDCRVYCDPETCACSVAGIKCQVDRLSFPCGCSKDGCSNPVGRIEFNPIRVRTHFIHTVMRLEMDRKREQITQMCAPRTSTCDYPQSSCGDASSQAEPETEDGCQGDGVETRDGCDKNYPNGEMECLDSGTDRDSENENTNIATARETNIQSSKTSSPRPQKSCLKRVPQPDSKNARGVTQFNSNERGSCRDCGNTDVTEMLMAGAHFVDSTTPLEMEPIIPSQTKVVDCTNNQSNEVGSSDSVDASSPQHSGDNTQQQQQHFQQVMLFGDGDEEEYSAENGNMYGFKPEDSSYSESSDPDCCSEGSDDGRQQQAVANGQFNTCSNSAEGANVTASHYCIPGPSYEASTAQPEQKYMDLNSSTSGYKLEPISEILNPLRFASYDSNSLSHHQNWHPASTATYQYSDSTAGTLPRYPARYPSMQQPHQDNAQSAGSAIGNQGYYNNTEQSTTNMLPYQQPPPHQASGNSAGYHDNGTIPCISTSHNLADKSCDLPFNQTDTSVVKDTDEDSGFKDLSASSSTASSPVKDDDDVAPKYHDLTSTSSVSTSSQFTDLGVTSSVKNSVADPAIAVVTSDDDSNCRYTTLLSPTRQHGAACDKNSSQSTMDTSENNSKCRVQEGTTASLYQELDEEYILPKRTSVVAVPTDTINSSPISQNEIKGSEINHDQSETSGDDDNMNIKSQGHEGKNGKGGVSEMSSSSKESQNFGEIIKESIVETVSA